MREEEGLQELGSEKAIGRRRLLMTLATAGGAAAALKVLPKQWTKPVVDMVELPVHAQGSNRELFIEGLLVLDNTPKTPAPPPWRANFEYQDPLAEVSDSASLYAWITSCGEGIFNGNTLTAAGATRVGTPSMGNISVSFGLFQCSYLNQMLHLKLGVGTRNSNELTALFPAITPA